MDTTPVTKITTIAARITTTRHPEIIEVSVIIVVPDISAITVGINSETILA